MKISTFLAPALAVTFTGLAFGQADECAAATDLGVGSSMIAFDTNNCVDTMAPATTSAEQQCFSLSNDVWFKYTASQSGATVFSTCNAADFDTEIGIWDGADCSTMVGLGCNDDFTGCTGNTSQISLTVVAGQTYHIQLGYWSASGSTWGTGTLSVTELAPPANDDCTAAVPVTLGATPFDSTGATDGAQVFSCVTGGNDVWFTYTAGSTMDLDFETCGSAYDTAVEVYTGTCAAPVSVGCNDDACSTQSRVTVSGVNVGDTFLIQVGGWNGATGTGTLTINEVVPPPANCAETLFASNNGGSLGGAVYFDMALTQNSTFSGIVTNTGVAAGSPVGLSVYTTPMTAVGNETNPGAWTLVAEDDGLAVSAGDDGETSITFVTPFSLSAGSYGIALVGENFTTGVQLDHEYTNGTATNQSAQSPDGVISLTLGGASNVPFSGSIFSPRVWNGRLCHAAGDPGTNYCMTTANSSGAPAVMGASGTSLVANNDLVLECDNMPLNAFAYFLTSQNQGFIANPGGSQGNLCITLPIGRYVGPGQVQNSGTSGSISLAIDLTMHPQPTGFVVVQAGETWNFQCWFRDTVGGSATSNFSDGLEVMFQ